MCFKVFWLTKPMILFILQVCLELAYCTWTKLDSSGLQPLIVFTFSCLLFMKSINSLDSQISGSAVNKCTIIWSKPFWHMKMHITVSFSTLCPWIKKWYSCRREVTLARIIRLAQYTQLLYGITCCCYLQIRSQSWLHNCFPSYAVPWQAVFQYTI